MDYNKDLISDFVQVARLGLSGRPQDVQLLLRRVAKKYGARLPDLSETLTELLREAPTRSSPLRRDVEQAVPVDLDSRLQLLRVEPTANVDHEPVLAPHLKAKLSQLLAERRHPERLINAGLQPTRSVLFTGAPGVGKTLTARWLAREMGRPLMVLDLAAVMSSYLGRTGNNVRNVLDYAKQVECVLLLDELDAIAKRRDDGGEVGELKRLVTVLLQEVDDWPSTGLMVAATNHPDLLDPAAWRRFEMVLEFPMPSTSEIESMATTLLDSSEADVSTNWPRILATVFAGRSFSDLERRVNAARRMSAVTGNSLSEQLQQIIREDAAKLSKADRIHLAATLVEQGTASQRQAHELTGVSRDTIRKAAAPAEATSRTITKV